ncbi:hypothetical protein SYNPS1DRAFT_28443 [Syncephalis pseudoplumigaleata]|uniref:PH domain-containing protein n=1 Tax=Syncephalis pseudoplumigaleata TaxID=1712513 RepID=A0A4P9Z1K6_9FUNG|nr:hypothetical protein SYNPS1DRAFT_28443 [Syncephalis pseudoplumigaleata]|eukprot:RKP25832.1 hypothetical protein SYNPS1DRAFT_28443 [Syncephalis pseudoplumigaleata]
MSTQHQNSNAPAPSTAEAATRQASNNRFSRSQLDPIPFSDESDSEPEAPEPALEHGNNEQAALCYESDEQYELDDMEATRSQLTEVTREQTINAGYLMKRGELRKTWKKRWFVLRQSELVYYKDQKEYKLLGIIPLDSILACAEVQRTKKRKSKRANVFGIVTTKRKFYFSAPSPEDMLSWLRLIRETRANAIAGRTASPDEASPHAGPLKRQASPTAAAHPDAPQAALEISATSLANGRTVTFLVQNDAAAGPASASPGEGRTSPAARGIGAAGAGGGGRGEDGQEGGEQTSFDDYADDEFDLKSDDDEAAAIILADAEEIWKKRWFVLRPTQLVYYKDQREYKSLGIIDLAHIKAVAAIPRKKRMNVFGVLTIHRKYYFQAGSPEELLGWIHALRETCQAATGRHSLASDGGDAAVAADMADKPASHRRSLLPSWATPARPSGDSASHQQAAIRASSNRSETSIGTMATTPHPDDGTPASAWNEGGEPMLQGYLTKLSQNSKVGRIRTWQKRWFVLRDNCLTYYKNDKESTPRQSIALAHVQAVQVVADPPSKQRPFCLQLVTPERPYLLAADTSILRDRWCQAIERILRSRAETLV